MDSGKPTRRRQRRAGAARQRDQPILTGLSADERFARNDVSGRTYFLADALNSTLALTDATGATRQQYSYDPYGNVTQSDTTSGFTNPYQYTGREADSAGLYYYRARYYIPVMASFIGEDPLGLAGGQPSLFAYVNGSPLIHRDPSGELVPEAIVGGIIGAAYNVFSVCCLAIAVNSFGWMREPDS